jgi:hypothetical protein
MKKIIALAFVFTSLNSFSQSAAIKLKKGQIITSASVTENESEMSMGMTMKNNSNVSKKITVIDEDATTYTITNTITRMKMDMEGMGQNMSYDSDKAEDKDSEMGKTVAEKINVSDTFTLNKVTGAITAWKKQEADSEAGAMGGMMSMMGGGEDQAANDAFFILPTNKKIGDSWSDVDVVTKGITTKKSYSLKSTDKNIATIGTTITIEGSTEQEMQGMTANVTMNAKTTGDIMVDTQTGLVTKRDLKVDVNSTIEMMGQSMPINSKGTNVSVYTVN